MLGDNTSSADGLDRGVAFKWHNGSAVKTGFFGFDIQTQRFVFTNDEDLSGGDNASSPWHDAQFGGVYAGNVQVGITGDNEIDTTSGNLTIDSAGGTTTIDDALTVSGIVELSHGNGLRVEEGGTGKRSITTNAVLVGAGTSAPTERVSSAAGNVLQGAANGTVAWSNIIDGGTY